MHRYKSWARQASDRYITPVGTGEPGWGESILPTYSQDNNAPENDNGDSSKFDEKRDLRPVASSSSNGPNRNDNGLAGTVAQVDGSGNGPPPAASAASNNVADAAASASPPPAPPPIKSEAAGAGNPPVDLPTDGDNAEGKRSIPTRMLDGSKRFVIHVKEALFHTWVNVLLVFVPIGIAADAAGLSSGLIFGANAVAIIPLAGMLAHATEAVASRLGDTWGALLNVSFGNAVELIIFIIALVKNEISIVQAALLGSILANLLLILGMAFLLGGLRYQEQLYNNTVTQMSACLLSLSVVSLLLPTAFHASFKIDSADVANSQVLKVSRGTSVVLLLVYFLYLLFQLKSHSYLYESTPQAIIDEESHPGVFADIMNSSSSSDSSSTDDSSDTDASTSMHNAGKKIKRAFKNRRRRKSSASTSSTVTSAVPSAPSSSSAKEQGSSAEHSVSAESSRRASKPATIGSPEDGDADTDEEHLPRIRDFVKQQIPGTDARAAARGKHKTKHKKHHKKHRNADANDASRNYDTAILDDEITIESPIQFVEEPVEMLQQQQQPRVNFAEQVDVNAGSSRAPPRSTFNRRQLVRRPALPKMLSQNVFVAQAPQPASASRPMPVRSQSSTAALRRTSSLPDRLNSQFSQQGQQRQGPYRTDALPPFHHQAARQQMSGSSYHSQPENNEDNPEMSRTAAVVLLLISTALVAVCAEFMVDAIPSMLASSNVSQAFIGLIVLPIVSNAAEHVTAVTVAAKNKMDLAIGVAVGSSIQIALLVTPLVVLLGWILGRDMSLYFNLFDTISLFVTAFVVNFLVLDGRSNYLEGSLLIAAYVIIALGAYFYPKAGQASLFGGGAEG